MTTTTAPSAPIWYPDEDVTATFQQVFRIYDPVLRHEHKKGWLSRETSISRHNLLLLSKEILLALNASGATAAELLEWLKRVGEERAKNVTA